RRRPRTKFSVRRSVCVVAFAATDRNRWGGGICNIRLMYGQYRPMGIAVLSRNYSSRTHRRQRLPLALLIRGSTLAECAQHRRAHENHDQNEPTALALVAYGFVTLGLQRIVGVTSLQNHASQRVLLKSGLHRNGERTLKHPYYLDAGPQAWFERAAAEWLAE